MNKKLLVTGALSIATVIGAVGGSMLHITQTQAADTTATNAVTAQVQTTPQTSGQLDPAKGGHVGSNGKKEELLTGDTAEKAKTAALAAVPGGTIERVETDVDGAVYEAHMKKADGTRVTVLFDANFKVTNVETGGPGKDRGIQQ